MPFEDRDLCIFRDRKEKELCKESSGTAVACPVRTRDRGARCALLSCCSTENGVETENGAIQNMSKRISLLMIRTGMDEKQRKPVGEAGVRTEDPAVRQGG